LIDPNILDDVAKRLSGVLPEGVQAIRNDMENNFKTILQNTFARMDLVTREEFDVQTEVLKRTREKLENLEKQIADMEAKIAEKQA